MYGKKVQKSLKVNADVEQTIVASKVSTQVNAFFEKYLAAKDATNTVFSGQLTGQLTYSLLEEITFTNLEVTLLKQVMSTFLVVMFNNIDKKGTICLKDMTEQFAQLHNKFKTNQYACFEDFTTYVAFSTEFINNQMVLAKCQAEAELNYLPACIKQISKKTSKIYEKRMYNTCLGNVNNFNSFLFYCSKYMAFTVWHFH